MLGIESHAIVRDIELHTLGSAGESYLRVTRVRVAGGVRERLLSHPVDAQGGGAIDRADALVGTEDDLDRLLSRELVTVGLQDRDEASVVEDTRMQVVRQVPDVGGERGGALLKGGHDLCEVWSRT